MSGAAVAAVVLASCGGARLARALAGVAWAGTRVVLDPSGRLVDEPLPDGVTRAATLGPTASPPPWLFLVTEDEVVAPALATAVCDAVARPTRDVYRVRRELHGFGTAVVPAGAPVRLARREWADIRLGSDLTPRLFIPGGRPAELAGVLVAEAGDSLAAAVENLEADATALAVLLDGAGRGARLGRAAAATVAGVARVLVGRRAGGGHGGGPWARWCLAVVAGYRPMVAYAKLWEHRQAEAAALR